MVSGIGYAGDQVQHLLRVEEASGERAELALQDREHVGLKGREVVLGLLDPDKGAEEVVDRINGDGLQDRAARSSRTWYTYFSGKEAAGLTRVQLGDLVADTQPGQRQIWSARPRY